MFKAEGLDIEIQANIKSINFLDVEVDLATGEYRPYMKPNNILKYIDVNSNHPKCVINNTAPAGILDPKIPTFSMSVCTLN